MSRSTTSKFDRWIFDSFRVTAEGLGLFRIFASLFILFFLIPGQETNYFRFLSSLPPDFFAPPPGPMMLLDDFPPFGLFQSVYTLLIVSLLAMLVGFRTRWASLITGISILVLQGLIYSIGKINHEIIVSLVPIIMAFSNWGACFSVDEWQGRNKEKKVYSWPLTLLALFIGFMMFTAGVPKILGGWLDPSTQAVKGHILNQYFVKGRDALLAPFAIQTHAPVIWELLDWSTILFETGFLLAVWRPKWLKLFLIIAVVFHFSTQLLMNISFLPNFLAYSAFLNWRDIYQKNHVFVKRLLGYRNRRVAVAGFSISLLLVFSVLKWFSMKDILLPDTDLMLHESMFLLIAFVIAMYISYKYVSGRKGLFLKRIKRRSKVR